MPAIILAISACALRAQKLDPPCLEALNLAALALREQGDDAQRIEAFRKCLEARPRKESDPKASSMWHNYGNARAAAR